MKKTIAIVAFAAVMLFAGKANAQLGINVGYAPVTLSTATTIGNTTTTSTSEMDGFFAGVTYNYGISKDLGVAFGLQGRYNTPCYQQTFAVEYSFPEHRITCNKCYAVVALCPFHIIIGFHTPVGFKICFIYHVKT